MGLKAVVSPLALASVATQYPLTGGPASAAETVSTTATAGTDASLASVVPTWFKVGNALSYTTFQTAGTTKTNMLFSLIAAGIIHAIKLKPSTAFAGTLISAVTLSVGVSGTNDKYAAAFDVFQAVGAGVFELSGNMNSESHTGATNITITAISTGANLSALSAGVVDVWALLSVAK